MAWREKKEAIFLNVGAGSKPTLELMADFWAGLEPAPTYTAP